jgi:hypothetical protein
MTDMEAAAVISIAFIKRQAVNRHGDLGGWLARAFHEAGQPVLLADADPDRSALDRAGRAGGFPFRIVHLPRRDLDKRIAGYTRPDDLVITGCGQLEDHAGIARAVLGSRGSGLSAERDAPPWCCMLLNRTAANAQLNGRGPAGPGGGRVHGARHGRSSRPGSPAARAGGGSAAKDSGRREIIRDLEQDMKIPARGLWHQPGAASAERAVHAPGRMLADLGHLRAGLATEAVR